MKTVELPKGRTIDLQITPKELPIHRYAEHQKYLIQAAGIGSEIADADAHFGRLNAFLGAGMVQEAAQESINLQYGIRLALNKINIKSVAFACLVHKFDGKEIEDYTEDGLIALCERMGQAGLKQIQVEDILEEVKKKSIPV